MVTARTRPAVVVAVVLALVAGVLAAQAATAPAAHAAPAYPQVDPSTLTLTDPIGSATAAADPVEGHCYGADGGDVRAVDEFTGYFTNGGLAGALLECRPFATPSPAIDYSVPIYQAGVETAAPLGGPGQPETCPQDDVVVGLAATTQPGPGGDAITDVQPYCSPLDNSGRTWGVPTPLSWLNGSDAGATPVLCPSGSYLVGLQAEADNLVFALQLECDAPVFDPAGVAANVPHTLPGAALAGTAGYQTSGGQEADATCGDGVFATGVNSTTRPTEGEPYEEVSGLGLQCTPEGGTPAHVALENYLTRPAMAPADPNASVGGVQCPAGAVLTGLAVTGDPDQQVLGSLAPYCSQLSAEGGLLTAPTLVDGATGIVGDQAFPPVLCPTGTFVVGLRLAVEDSGYGLVPYFVDVDCSRLDFGQGAVTPQPANSSWTTATLLQPTDSTTQALTSPGGALWYRFPVQPSSAVRVDLTGLAQDDDLTVFSDIGQAFTSLTSTADLTRLSAEFAGVDFAPTTFSPTTFSPTTFSPTTFSPTTFSPTTFSPTTFSPTTFSPTTFSPTTFSPDVTPEQYFEAGAFADESALAGAYSSAQTRSVLGVSAHDGLTPESLQEQTFNHTGYFYVRVTARNGAVSPQPFSLAVTTTGGPCSVQLNTYAGDTTLVGTPGSVGTVVLTDSSRLTGSAADVATLAAANRSFSTFTGAALVDVAASQKVSDLQAQAAANPGCPYAKNLVAQAIRDIVNTYRNSSGTLKYVVIEGNDSVIPFFRYADNAGVAPESGFSPPVSDTSASDASLRNNMVLGQDAYGSLTDVSISGISMPVPDLAVGRVVETPAEIAATLTAFVAKNGAAITPTSTLATGYDFLAAGAKQVASSFAAADTGGRNDTLITNQGVDRTLTTVGGVPSPTRTWTAADLKTSLFGSKHDVVYLAGHFSANAALAADFSSVVTTRDLAAAPATTFQNTLVFSAGCHSGYNTVDPDGVAGVTDTLDWAQAFAQKGATLVAGTGYQYGDTDFVKYSNELYVDFTNALRTGTGAVSVGAALAQAKHDYLAGQASLDGVDQKSLLEATLFGLPMQGVNFSSGRLAPPVAPTALTTTPITSGPGAVLGLSSATVGTSGTPTTTTVPLAGPAGNVTATYLSGPGGAVEVTPAAPTLPLVVQNATAPAGTVLRGVGLRSGTYTDQTGVTPLTGAPATETNTVHGPFVSDVFYPNHLATPNYFDALSGSPSTGATRLLVTPAQYRSDAPGSATDVQRTYSALGFSVFYSGNRTTYGANVPATAAPPSFSGVVATPSSDNRSLLFATHVVGDPSAGIQSVWVTWTDPNATTSPKTWQSIDLVQDSADSTLWTATLTLPGGQLASDVQYLVQAVNGVGVVGADDAAGHYYRPAVVNPPVPAATSLTLASTVPATGTLGGTIPVSATLVDANGAAVTGQPVTFGLGGSSIVALTNAAGIAATTLPITGTPGASTLTASFAGTPALAASAAAARQVTVAKRPTATTIVATTAGYQVTLTDTSVAGHPVGIPARTVFVAATGAGGAVLLVLPLLTDANGRATVTAASLPAGATALTPYFGSASTPTATPNAATFDDTDPSFAAAPPASTSLVPSRIAIAPVAPSTVAGTAVTFSASASYPPSTAAVDVTARAAFSIVPTAGGSSTGASCNGSACVATAAGTYTVTATFLGQTSSTTLRVTPAALDHITVSPASASIVAGTSRAFTAAALDRYNNLIGDVTAATGFGIVPTSAGSSSGAACTAASCTATIVGAYRVTGTYSGKTATAALTVTPAAAASVTATSGTPQTAAAGSAFSTALAAQALDAYGNPVAGVSVTFQVPAGSTTTGAATFPGGARTAAVTTAANGIATAPVLTAGAQTGPLVVTAALTATPTASTAVYQLTVTTAGTTSKADLSVSVSAPSAVSAGGSVSVTVKVTNQGPSVATKLGTVLVVPWGATISAAGGGTVVGKQVVFFTTASLASGASATYTVTATVGRTKGIVLFAAGGLSAVPDPNLRNNVGVALTQVR